MSIEATVSAFDVTDVNSIVVTPVVEDETAGTFSREIRVFDAGGLQVFTVRVSADGATKIEITAPSSVF